VPEHASDEGAESSRQAREFFRREWQGKTFMAIGQQDPVLGEQVMRALAADLRGCGEPLVLPEAGHFVQEHGESIARESVAFFAR
jgi:tRNA(adenine34) deaminase